MRRTLDDERNGSLGSRHPAASPHPAADRGRFGEALAAAFLRQWGYQIVSRNRRVGRLELDLVAVHRHELVIVEVRLRTREDHGSAEETVDRRKRARLRSAGRRVWEETGRPDLSLRFDLVAILVRPDGLRLRHHVRFLDPEGPGAESLRGRF
ncbi:MAG: YraN family protein [Candidatus Eisenbacteria bacterium]|uniref:UPF0102 protein KDA27_10140 n=1 Tax=Eiseniibacteriota bacterium TaxID=2212470 RepID=A0A956NBJ2_UNCEI|nr:YraN family protein [Candidatus Eisenbacteria bacterium]MCB9464866.1 YraN family protein [Candidatus Eisenbacteria bacterium]